MLGRRYSGRMEDILYGVIVAVVATLILAMLGAAGKRIRGPRGAVSESDLAAEIAKHDAEELARQSLR